MLPYITFITISVPHNQCDDRGPDNWYNFEVFILLLPSNLQITLNQQSH